MDATMYSMAVFASVTLGILGGATLLFDLFLRRRARIDERFKAAFRDQMRDRAEQSPLFKDLQQLSIDGDQPRVSLRTRLVTIIEQAGLTSTVDQLALLSIALGVMMFAAVCWACGNYLLGGLAALLTACLPMTMIWLARRKRMAVLCRQLPEAFDVMSRALKAGQTVQAAFQSIANDFSAPIAEEFAHCYEQQHLGISYDATLRDLGRRAGIKELQLFAVALIVNRRTGGNLAELLPKLSGLLRKRARFQGRVKALTGEGRLQAAVLMAMPVLLFCGLLLFKRDYAEVLLDMPYLLGGTVLAQFLAAGWIHSIVSFEY